MHYKQILLTLLLAANCVAMKAQVVYTKDPYVFLDMDLEAKEGVYTASLEYLRAIKAGKVRETLVTL